MPDPSGIVITTVHGTWARRAPWAQHGSALCRELSSSLPLPVLIQPFQWSGKNSMIMRVHAANQLAAVLQQQLARFPDARHFVIGHSHGGNVAARALHIANLHSSVSLIFLATPFFIIVPRNYGGAIGFHLIVGTILCILGLYQAGFLYLTIHYPARWVFWTALLAFVLLCPPTIQAVVKRIVLTSTRATDFVRKIKMELPESASILILRILGDEAATGIGAAQFANMLLTSIIRKFHSLISWLQARLGWKLSDGLAYTPRLMGRMLLGHLFIWRMDKIHDNPGMALPWGSISNGILAAGAIVAFLPVFWLTLIILLSASFLLVTPLLLLIMLVAVIPFGFDGLAIILDYEILVETAPMGRWTTKSLSPELSDKLRHSTIYDHPLVFQAIADWIKEGLASPPASPAVPPAPQAVVAD